MTRPIIFDCDPGNDDAVALLVTFASPESFNVLGVTTVAGNVGLDQTVINALKVCELAGRSDVPVFAGCAKPLVRDLVNGEVAHGETGIDGAVLPEPKAEAQPEHAVDFIIRTLKSYPEKVTMFLTGPYTNMATALKRAPEILDNVEEIVLMGGNISAGNITPYAEFNFFCDPDAAKIVMECGAKMTLLNLDVTHQVHADIDRLRAVGNNPADQVANMAEATCDFDITNFGLEGRAVHDALVPTYVMRPDLFTVKPAYLQVDDRPGDSYGGCLVSFYNYHVPDNPNIYVANDVNAGGVFDFILERLGRYSVAQQAQA